MSNQIQKFKGIDREMASTSDLLAKLESEEPETTFLPLIGLVDATLTGYANAAITYACFVVGPVMTRRGFRRTRLAYYKFRLPRAKFYSDIHYYCKKISLPSQHFIETHNMGIRIPQLKYGWDICVAIPQTAVGVYGLMRTWSALSESVRERWPDVPSSK